MKRHPNIVLAALLAILLAAGAVQGNRVRHLRESELFYRWILAEATQSRLFDDLSAADEEEMMDRALFGEIMDTAEPALPAEVPDEESPDKDGKPLRQIIVFARGEQHDKEIWDLARGDLLARQRTDFLRYLREKRLSSVASQFDAADIYSGEGPGVSLANIALGFRKLAANFVWLQVDKYWHQGAMHRMIPLMKTCVTLDPNFVDAYQIGAWHLAYNATAHMLDTPEPLKEWNSKYKARIGEKELYYYLGIDFLKDGIRKNPRDYRLYFDLGFAIYNLKLKDYANAVTYLAEAVRYKHDRWVPRQLYICLEKNGEYERAMAGWQSYLEKNLGDPERDIPPNHIEIEKAKRFIARSQGLLKEHQADEAAEQAAASEDPVAAAALRDKADLLRQEAFAIWQGTAGTAGELDSFAIGRVMRMKAHKLIEEERFLEAIAILENARWQSNPFFEEASEMIIDSKIKAGVPLSVSEKKAVLRKEEAERYKKAPPEESS